MRGAVRAPLTARVPAACGRARLWRGAPVTASGTSCTPAARDSRPSATFASAPTSGADRSDSTAAAAMNPNATTCSPTVKIHPRSRRQPSILLACPSPNPARPTHDADDPPVIRDLAPREQRPLLWRERDRRGRRRRRGATPRRRHGALIRRERRARARRVTRESWRVGMVHHVQHVAGLPGDVLLEPHHAIPSRVGQRHIRLDCGLDMPETT
ncbi:MAG: hypothetical protein HS111_13055 [Kofleriaceae bacterium]|nr:hypothetical protein [Kofleriaceae bacterium]